MADEFASHLEFETEENVRRGMTPAEAHRAALLKSGGIEAAKEAYRDRRGFPRVDALRIDVKLAWRSLRRTPTVSVSVVAILAIGIGLAVAMTTTSQAVLARPLPVRDADRLVVLWPTRAPEGELAPPATDLPMLESASRTMHGFAGVAHWGVSRQPYLVDGKTAVLTTSVVTGNFFDLLGARPVLGRLLRPQDSAPGAAPTVVLSYAAWQAEFAASRAVIGREITEPTSRIRRRIVGVAPRGLDYPIGVDAWIPNPPATSPASATRLLVLARLANAETVAAARDEFLAIIKRLEPTWRITGAVAETFPQAVTGRARPVLIALTSAVGLLLLIACVNVGNLLLVRAMSRRRELQVRRALGASVGTLMRQLGVESGILASAGSLLGIGVAALSLRAIVVLGAGRLPRLNEVQLDRMSLVVTLAIAVAVTLLCGILPSTSILGSDPGSALRLDWRVGTATRLHQRARKTLVALQLGFALVLLAGAGLLARSLRGLQELPLGYGVSHLSIASVAFDATRIRTPSERIAMSQAIVRGLDAVPGVVAAAPILTRPFGGAHINIGFFEADGQSPAEIAADPAIPWEAANSQYFTALGIPILQGRAIRATDRADMPAVVVVSQSVADRFWPGKDPIGQRIRLSPSRTGAGVPASFLVWRTVVGVAADTRFRDLRQASPTIYVAWQQWPIVSGMFAIRSAQIGGITAGAIRRQLRQVDPSITLWRLQSMDDVLGEPLAGPRLDAGLLSVFAGAALLLAAIGLYGVVASTVREQTREIGIRMALGAVPSNIRKRVLLDAATTAALGAVIGLGGALVAMRLIKSMLFDVASTDPVTLTLACGTLAAVVVVAAYLPARRASRIDPVAALRAE